MKYSYVDFSCGADRKPYDSFSLLGSLPFSLSSSRVSFAVCTSWLLSTLPTQLLKNFHILIHKGLKERGRGGRMLLDWPSCPLHSNLEETVAWKTGLVLVLPLKCPCSHLQNEGFSPVYHLAPLHWCDESEAWCFNIVNHFSWNILIEMLSYSSVPNRWLELRKWIPGHVERVQTQDLRSFLHGRQCSTTNLYP